MALRAVAGALGFLSRVPVGRDGDAFEAFAATPAAFPLVGYPIGALVAVAVVVPVGPPTTALLLLAALGVVTGINHLDGVADLGDAAVVHGDRAARRAVLDDATLGVGGTAAVAGTVAGVALAGLALGRLPVPVAVGIVLAAEVGAKLGMALLACLGTPAHEGLGAMLAGRHEARDALVPVVVALPAGLATVPSPAAVVAVGAAVLAALSVGYWARSTLGGVSGDAFGAANELGRVAALHAGVVAWTLS